MADVEPEESGIALLSTRSQQAIRRVASRAPTTVAIAILLVISGWSRSKDVLVPVWMWVITLALYRPLGIYQQPLLKRTDGTTRAVWRLLEPREEVVLSMSGAGALRILRRTALPTVRATYLLSPESLVRKGTYFVRFFVQLRYSFGYRWLILLFYLAAFAVAGGVSTIAEPGVNRAIPIALLAVELFLLVLLFSLLTIRLSELRQFSFKVSRLAATRLRPSDEIRSTREQLSRLRELLLAEQARATGYRDDVLAMRDRIAETLGFPMANQVVSDEFVPLLQRQRDALRREHRFSVSVSVLIMIVSLVAGAIITKLMGG